MTKETTASLQTPPGRGGIAVIALAGPSAEAILGEVFRPWPSHAGARDGRLQLGYLIDGGRRIDEAVIFRRDGSVEINIHGGPQVARAAMAALKRRGARLVPAPQAAPETFAVAHPRWNNPAVGAEMLDALPLARSALVAAAITQQWSGGISRLACSIGERLAGRPAADAETDRDSCLTAAAALGAMDRLLHPAEVVLAGPPNAGKSTLANALTARQVSIVHRRAGTTRDWVREQAMLDGVPIWLTDTAGLWSAADALDAEAVRRAHARASEADVVVLLAAETPPELPAWWRAQRVIRVASKCDICPAAAGADVEISARTGRGLDELARAIIAALGLSEIRIDAPMAFTRRQATLLGEAAAALDAGDFRAAGAALERLLGR